MKLLLSLMLIGAFVLPTVLAHVTPTSGQQAIIDANTAPSTSVLASGACSEVGVNVVVGTTYIAILGYGESSSGTGTLHAQMLSSGGAQIDFRVRQDGTITNIAAGVTAHLLMHQNISVSGGASGGAFWAAVEYSPSSSTDSTVTIGGADGSPYYLPMGAVDSAYYPALVGNYTQSGGSCTGTGVIQGRLFKGQLGAWIAPDGTMVSAPYKPADCVIGNSTAHPQYDFKAQSTYYIYAGGMVNGSVSGSDYVAWDIRSDGNASVMFLIKQTGALTTPVPNGATSIAYHENLSLGAASFWAVINWTPSWNVSARLNNHPQASGGGISSSASLIQYNLSSPNARWFANWTKGSCTDRYGGAYTDNITLPPSTPTLTGSVDGVWNDLSWTPSAGATGGYILTRCDLWNSCTVFYLGPTTYAYRDGGDTTNRTYTVKGWSLVAGNSTVSNSVVLKIAAQNLFADNSPLYGGSKTGMASALGMPSGALGVFIGLLLVLLLTAGGWAALGPFGGLGGALAGVMTALAAGMWPIWVIFLLLAVAGAAFVLSRNFVNREA